MSDGQPPEDASGQDGNGEDNVERIEFRLDRLHALLNAGERLSAFSVSPKKDSDFDGANDEALAIRLATLEQEHRDLDAAITSLEINSPYERLTIARLKKKKLALKDVIQEIKDNMLPDIIA